MMKRLGLMFVFFVGTTAAALAQSSPGLIYGQVPTPAQWNLYFANKQDYNPGTGGTPGGANTDIQFNNSSVFGGSAAFIWDGTGVTIGLSGTLGYLQLGNATSGLIRLQPVTGALGTPTILLPAASTTLAALSIEDQTLAGGVNVTAKSLSTGSIAADCGARPIQTITNGGAYTITAPSSDGYCLLKVTNNGSAGATTFTGFSVGSNTGDALDTTNGHKFIISIITAGGDSTYSVKALQ